MTKPDTLDEQIEQIIDNYHDWQNEQPEAMDRAKQQLKTLFTEHSKQEVLKELKTFICHSNEIPEHVIKHRIAQLSKRNK